jgi:hypothetical protein
LTTPGTAVQRTGDLRFSVVSRTNPCTDVSQVSVRTPLAQVAVRRGGVEGTTVPNNYTSAICMLLAVAGLATVGKIRR